MTQEEKAKAYDEALKVLHKYDGAHIMFTQDLKEEMFPELKESEDERIRKALIEFVKSRGGFKQEYIAWLENKAEQKPAWSKEDENHIDSLLERLKGLCRNEFIRTRFAINEDEDWLKSIKDRVLPQPKQEWNEEDEIYISDVLWCVEQARKVAKDENDMGTTWCAENWLKSIKDRIQPQPKQEWSEEDEDKLKTVISFMNSNPAINPFYDKMCLKDWLKSLKDRYTWKPSDEQMEALEKECIAHSNYELCRLLEQLKKLRGE